MYKYSLTIATSNTRTVTITKANEFIVSNPNTSIDSIISSLNNVLWFFIGGTTENSEGKWTLFTETEAQRQANLLIQVAQEKQVSNIVLVTHGVRTFANPKSDDPYVRELNRFEAYNSFITKLSIDSKASGIPCLYFWKK